MKYGIRMNVGTLKEPKYIYYTGLKMLPNKAPDGPLFSEHKEEAKLFDAEQNCLNLIGGIDGLRGGDVIEYPEA